MIDLASDEEYYIPNILALTSRVQRFAQVVVKLWKNNNLNALDHV